MLLRFVFENFMSFKKNTVVDLEAASIREIPENTITITNTSVDLRVLKSLAIYGANASGKSNILKAFAFTRNFVLSFSNNQLKAILEPYRLDSSTEKKPSLFEVSILIDGIKYRYGFALTAEQIIKEWLYITEKRKEELLFERSEQEYIIEKKFRSESEGNTVMLSKITREDTLFLSTLGQFKSEIAKKVIDWFNRSIVVFESNNQEILNYTAGLLKESFFKSRINDIVNKADLNFSSVEAELLELSRRTGFSTGFIAALYEDKLSDYRIKTAHTKYAGNKVSGKIFFDLILNESLGSQKFVMLLGPLLKAIRDSSLILIDELDSRLHTNLLLFVLRFFNSPTNNPLGSQLIYTSHNSVILKKDLRRDQMFFVKRDQQLGSLVTTLHNWDSKIRSDASFDKDYLEGKYGAIPKIDLAPNLFDS